MIRRVLRRLRGGQPGLACVIIFAATMLSVRPAAAFVGDEFEWLGTLAAVAGLIALAFALERRSS